MRLTQYEKEILDGKHGEAKRIAMRVLEALGEIYHAEKTIPVTAAHIDGCSYGAVWDAGLDFSEKLAALGGKVAVPTTLNITARDIENWPDFKMPPEYAEKNRRMEAAYYEMGCIPTWTCAAYQYAENMPAFGEQVAFAESNVVNYTNSVRGARTERYGDLVDICCALVGRVPELGLHITENRRARHVFDVSGLSAQWFKDTAAFAALGHYVGSVTGQLVPAVTGLPVNATHEDLKAFSAASAASGSVGLFHMVGFTPEAPTLAAATQEQAPDKTTVVTDAMFEEILAGMSQMVLPEQGNQADLVVIGCPHVSYGEIDRLMGYMGEAHVANGTEFWLQTNDTVYRMMQRTGILERVTGAGMRVMRDSCLLNQPMEGWGFKTVVTNSGKMAHYAPGNLKADVYFRNMEQCVKIGISGRIEEQ